MASGGEWWRVVASGGEGRPVVASVFLWHLHLYCIMPPPLTLPIPIRRTPPPHTPPLPQSLALFTEIFTDLCVEGEFDDHSLTPEAMRPVINTILIPGTSVWAPGVHSIDHRSSHTHTQHYTNTIHDTRYQTRTRPRASMILLRPMRGRTTRR